MGTSSSGISVMEPVIIGSTPISSFDPPAFSVSQPSSSFLHPSPSPTCVDLEPVPPSPRQSGDTKKRECMCEATTHPGSCRCSLRTRRSVKGHRQRHCRRGGRRCCREGESRRQWNMVQRWALRNTLVRSGAAKEMWVNRALLALLRRPSSSRQQKRKDRSFQPRPSRLSIMSKVE